MAHPDNLSSVIWQLGDPWRDLRDEIVAAGTTTIVTAHLTTHILDLGEHLTTRLPSLLGSELKEDGSERTLLEVEIATPCGLVTRCDPIERSQLSTPLLLVLPGAHPDWMTTYLPQLAGSADHLLAGLSPLHPPSPCGALYCPAPAPRPPTPGQPGADDYPADHEHPQ